MAHYGEAYQNLCNVQKALINLILGSEDMKGSALCAREVVAIEQYKRELRGQPRLKAADAIRALKPANAGAIDLPTEVSEPLPAKESLKHSFPATVTTPPTGTPPSAGE